MKIQVIGAFEAKTRLSELLECVHRGQTFQITRRGQPVAMLGPVEPVPHKSGTGPSLTRRFAEIRQHSKPGPGIKELVHMGHKH
jgi:prevent-host-death family protein